MPNSVHSAPPSISRQATFRLPGSSTPRTPPQIILPHMHTPLWCIAVKQHVGHLFTARDVLYAGEPAVRAAATLTRILPHHFQLDGYVGGHQPSFWTHVVMSCSGVHRDMERSRSGLPDVQPRRNWPGHNGRPSGAAAHDAPGEWLEPVSLPATHNRSTWTP